jgi:predicted Fe-Mo cluster-binding NifX family protein
LKLAITSEGKDLNSSISPVFGRSPIIILVDLDEKEIKNFHAIENPTLYEEGTGNLAAQLIVNYDVDILISGEMGPIVFHILKNAGIKVYKSASMNVEKNITRLIEGKLKEVTSLASGYPK